MITKKYLFIAGFFLSNAVYGQEVKDTAALIKEFSKLMSFTSQPYMHYVTSTRMNAEPVLQSLDTLTVTGEFFKNGTEIYSNNTREEMYLQDSLVIDINNDRKTIWISKVDMTSKDRMNVLPVNSKEMLDQLQQKYTISKAVINADKSRLHFEERKHEKSTSATSTSITVEYSEKTWLPGLIEIVIVMKQPVDDEMETALKNEGVDETKLMQVIDGVKYLVRKQVMSIAFTVIENDRQKLLGVPSYKEIFEFDSTIQEYVGKGQYRDYEITKTF